MNRLTICQRKFMQSLVLNRTDSFSSYSLVYYFLKTAAGKEFCEEINQQLINCFWQR